MGRRRPRSFVDRLLDRAFWACFGAAAATITCLGLAVGSPAPSFGPDAKPTGWVAAGRSVPPGVTPIVHSFDLIPSMQNWLHEIGNAYPHAVVVFTHGNDVAGMWVVEHRRLGTVPTTMLVAETRLQYPNRRIVLVACNPGGYTLDTPRVVYATTNIWQVPDNALGTRNINEPECIGNIHEFEETR